MRQNGLMMTYYLNWFKQTMEQVNNFSIHFSKMVNLSDCFYISVSIIHL